MRNAMGRGFLLLTLASGCTSSASPNERQTIDVRGQQIDVALFIASAEEAQCEFFHTSITDDGYELRRLDMLGAPRMWENLILSFDRMRRESDRSDHQFRIDNIRIVGPAAKIWDTNIPTVPYVSCDMFRDIHSIYQISYWYDFYDRRAR